MSVYAVSANDEESWKMIRDPGKNPDCHQNSSLGHASALHKLSPTSAHNFWRYYVHKKWLHTQTDTHTDHTIYWAVLFSEAKLINIWHNCDNNWAEDLIHKTFIILNLFSTELSL